MYAVHRTALPGSRAAPCGLSRHPRSRALARIGHSGRPAYVIKLYSSVPGGAGDCQGRRTETHRDEDASFTIARPCVSETRPPVAPVALVAAAAISATLIAQAFLPGAALAAGQVIGTAADGSSHGITITIEREKVERLIEQRVADRLHSLSDEQLADLLLNFTLGGTTDESLLPAAPSTRAQAPPAPALLPQSASDDDNEPTAMAFGQTAPKLESGGDDIRRHMESYDEQKETQQQPLLSSVDEDGGTADMLEGILGDRTLPQRLAESIGLSDEQQQQQPSEQGSRGSLEMAAQVMARTGTILKGGAEELLRRSGLDGALPRLPDLPELSMPQLGGNLAPGRLVIPAAVGLLAAVAAATFFRKGGQQQQQQQGQDQEGGDGSPVRPGFPSQQGRREPGLQEVLQDIQAEPAAVAQERRQPPLPPAELFGQAPRRGNGAAAAASATAPPEEASGAAGGAVLWSRGDDAGPEAEPGSPRESSRGGNSNGTSVFWQRDEEYDGNTSDRAAAASTRRPSSSPPPPTPLRPPPGAQQSRDIIRDPSGMGSRQQQQQRPLVSGGQYQQRPRAQPASAPLPVPRSARDLPPPPPQQPSSPSSSRSASPGSLRSARPQQQQRRRQDSRERLW